eukprot:744793-Pyramimonas_sp.AAC.1
MCSLLSALRILGLWYSKGWGPKKSYSPQAFPRALGLPRATFPGAPRRAERAPENTQEGQRDLQDSPRTPQDALDGPKTA